MTIINKAYKFRIYPNAAQRLQLARDFGHSRWVWNEALRVRSEAYRLRGEKLTGIDISRMLTEWKKLPATQWLNEANSTVLTQTLRDFDTAFGNFFAKRAKYPKRKRRENSQSARYQLDQRHISRTFSAGERLVLPKLGEIKVRWSQVPGGTPKMATVSKDPCGRYYVAFACEETAQPLPKTGESLGIDLGLHDVLAGSDGWKSGNPKHLAKKLRRLKRYQRMVSRKRGLKSNRRRKAVKRVAKAHANVANARRDWINKATTEIVRRADVIALEDLHVKGMMKNRRLARSLGDAGFGEIRRQLEYKAAWHGKIILFSGRFEPTSKTCSECGFIQKEMPLKIRDWVCPGCAAKHDRDINAARVILKIATGGNSPEGRIAAKARGERQTPSAGHVTMPGMLALDETRTGRRYAGASHG